MTHEGGISALITGGLGAAIGGVVTAVVQIVSRRGESRATAADLVTNAAGKMVDRLQRENRDLRALFLALIDEEPELMDRLQSSDKFRRAQAAAFDIGKER